MQWPVYEVEVYIGHPEPPQALLACLQGRVISLVAVPDLYGNEDIKSLSINSNNIRMWYNRAAVKLKMDDVNGCISDLREAMQIDKKKVIKSVVIDNDFKDLTDNDEFNKLL